MTGNANGFTINLPQISFGGSGGPNGTAFGLNFDFGGNPAAMAQSAYNFVNAGFATDQGFLQQSIAGTQNFLSHQVNPILLADTSQINANAKAIPGLYSSLFSANQSAISAIGGFTTAGLNAQSQAFQASIASSNAAANSGGFCFITTAACEWEGLPDDCATLQKFRKFRDTYMHNRYPDEVAQYYKTAPQIVKAIKARDDQDQVWAEIWCDYLTPAELAIDCGDFEAAHEIYCELVEFAARAAKGEDRDLA